uniref:Carboxylic ester hydrolase n=1 Tax=Anthurium amnicola TaxID=1678845 RepID=A0A1D1XT84_9ARAE
MSALLRVLAVLAVAGVVAVLAERPAPEARVAGGTLRGRWTRSRPSGRDVAAFEGIRYAKPPVDDLRFQPPVAADEPWTGVRAADKLGAVCPQRNFLAPGATAVEGSEDCLFLNVYRGDQSKPGLLPVMVMIHGGGFTNGASNIYGPEYLLDRDVVYVSINYRLFALGFLSTGDDVVPGNQGLKDMALALRWVRDNVRAFGGDPDNVTIFGESAGAASVHYLMLSPLTRGLFHRVIQMSGSALAPWALFQPAQARAKAVKLADALGCPSTQGSAALRDCLLTKSAEDIVKAEDALAQWASHPVVQFRPTVEPRGAGAFLDKHPAQVYADGGAHDVPVLTGVTSEEGCILATPIVEKAELLADLDKRFAEVASIIFYTDHLPRGVNDQVYATLRREYFGDRAVDLASVDELLQLTTDGFFSYSTLEAARLHARHLKSPVFLYELGRVGERSLALLLGATKETRPRYGVCHGDDLQYVFPTDAFFPQPPSASDEAFSRIFLDWFTTFALTGSPTTDGSWPAVKDTSTGTEYAFLDAPGLTVRRGFHNDRLARWSGLPVNAALAPGGGREHRDEL